MLSETVCCRTELMRPINPEDALTYSRGYSFRYYDHDKYINKFARTHQSSVIAVSRLRTGQQNNGDAIPDTDEAFIACTVQTRVPGSTQIIIQWMHGVSITGVKRLGHESYG